MPPSNRNRQNISRASFTRERPRAVFEGELEADDEPGDDEGFFFDIETNSGLLVLI